MLLLYPVTSTLRGVMVRASNAKLEPGKHSIDRATPAKQPDGTYWLRWRICLYDGRVKSVRTQGRTVGEVRARARLKAAEILATSTDGSWKLSDNLCAYIDRVSTPAIEAAPLADNSKARYGTALDQLKGVLVGHTIGTGMRFRALEKALQTVAERHGSESARQARTVLGKYVIQQLIRDEVLTSNPISGMSIDLTSHKPVRPQPERALTLDEFTAAIDWLLTLDPSDDIPETKRGRGGPAAAIAKRRALIDLALLQACSGLRVTEANALTWDVFDDSAEVSKSKTHRGRVVPLLFDDVVEHLARRRELGGTYVIGAPTDGTRQWDRDHCRKACATFYPEIGRAIGSTGVFEHGRTHIWRKTLNSLMLDVPEPIRAAYFGHDAEVNRRYYTDTTDVSPILNAARKLR